MNSLSFTIPGRPVPWARAGRSKSGHSFTPKKQEDHAELVRAAAFSAEPGLAMRGQALVGPLSLILSFCFEFPKKRTKTEMTSRPDLDNLVKQILDALNGFAFADDAQIVHVNASKMYVSSPSYTTVYIEEIA